MRRALTRKAPAWQPRAWHAALAGLAIGGASAFVACSSSTTTGTDCPATSGTNDGGTGGTSCTIPTASPAGPAGGW